MITFHNDNLVSPVLCELLYNTVDERLHRPVIFVPSRSDSGVRGRCYFRYIEIYLHQIYIDGWSGDFDTWKYLLSVAYHEFGHIATAPLIHHVRRQDVENRERAYLFAEQLANDWAKESILRLLEKDKRLFQPPSLGAYFEKRIIRTKKLEKKNRVRNSRYLFYLREFRKLISGGQLSSGDVINMIETWKHLQLPADESKRVSRINYKLLYKLADDLAYFYIDSAGRRHRYFAYGDVPEIVMRLARYEATHKPTRSFLEYQAQEGESIVPKSV